MSEVLSQVISIAFYTIDIPLFDRIAIASPTPSSLSYNTADPKLAKNEPFTTPTNVFIPGSTPSNRVNALATCTRTSST